MDTNLSIDEATQDLAPQDDDGIRGGSLADAAANAVKAAGDALATISRRG